jgi:hypothetical protein
VSSRTTPRNKNTRKTSPLSLNDANQPSGAHAERRRTRGWLRRFAGRAEAVRVFFTVLLARTSPDPVMPAGAAGPVAAAVSAVAGAAAAVAQRWPAVGQVPVWAAASAASGGLLLAPGWPSAGRNTS